MQVEEFSQTWIAVQAFAAAEKSAAMAKLANPRADHPTTQFYRGVYEAMDRLLSLASKEVRPVIEAPIPYEVGGV